MRGSRRLIVAGLVLSLCAATGNAFAAEKEPVSGGFLSLPGSEAPTPKTPAPQGAPAPAPVLVPAPAPALAVASAENDEEDDTSWGVLVRGGYFSLWNGIADEIFVQHPEVAGWTCGAEIRYHGEGGGRGVASVGLAVDSVTAKADGVWQRDASDTPLTGAGQIRMLAISLTGYLSLFPSWYVHPYFGLGIGVGLATGYYQDETKRVDADYWIPVVHLPVGLAIELGESLQLTIEGRFNDGIALGGALQIRF